MCGIVGYIGKDKAQDIIIQGLKKLEYRGYDSAGIAFYDGAEINLIKSVGKIANLEAKLGSNDECIGIGHTRWATHGEPNDSNSHPHTSNSGLITLVHNGIIENYIELKEEYLSSYSFYSDTDTEVLANLVEKFVLDGLSMEEALQKMIDVVEGAYAIAVVNTNNPDALYICKYKSPFLIGIGEGFNMLGSDALAMFEYTSEVVEIHDKEYGVLTRDELQLFDRYGNAVQRDSFSVNIDASDIDKGIYEHYMLKEINDQPSVIRKIISEYFNGSDVNIDKDIIKLFKDGSSIRIIAAGTSYYSGLVSQSLLEKFSGKQVFVHVASEFVYDTPLLKDNDLCVFISQSGETADLRAALVKVKGQGLKTLTITNVAGSTLAREADSSMLLYAGREIAVASTKAFVAQLTLLSIIGYALSDKTFALYEELSKAANIIDTIIEKRGEVEKIAQENLLDTEHCFILGRALDSKVALEAALKLKEISYIHAEGMSSGELKHGSIALIEEGMPVLFLITQGSIALNTRSNIQEVEARGGNTITVVMEKYASESDDIVFENISEEIAPIVAIVYFQLISYYTSLHLGREIDMPRNLAKSVTVE